MLEFFREGVSAFFRDDSRKPFVLYWFALLIALIDTVKHWKWAVILGPYLEGLPAFFAVRRHVVFILHPTAHILISAAFIGCMLKWPGWGIAVVFGYLFLAKVLLGLEIVGLFFGAGAIGESVQIPTYLILWEVLALLGLIAYMVKRDVVLRSIKQKSGYDVVDLGDRYVVFDKVTGEHVKEGEGPAPLIDFELGQGRGENRRREGAVLESSRPVKVPLQYEIQDGREGRIFIVRDPETGESTIYQSVDQMPPVHYNAFVRMLKDSGLWRRKRPGEDDAVESLREQLEGRREYRIEDGLEGRRFIVTDCRTGESTTYHSFDQVPPLHRDGFLHVLRATGESRRRRHDEDVGVEDRVHTAKKRREYKIQHRPEGRRFIVRDLQTGESIVYRSLDEMSPLHRDVFMRILKATGRRPRRGDKPSQDS